MYGGLDPWSRSLQVWILGCWCLPHVFPLSHSLVSCQSIKQRLLEPKNKGFFEKDFLWATGVEASEGSHRSNDSANDETRPHCAPPQRLSQDPVCGLQLRLQHHQARQPQSKAHSYGLHLSVNHKLTDRRLHFRLGSIFSSTRTTRTDVVFSLTSRIYIYSQSSTLVSPKIWAEIIYWRSCQHREN